VVQANLLAATTSNSHAVNQIYNVAVGERTSLNMLYHQLRQNLVMQFTHLLNAQPIYRDFRGGDVLHSLADISKAQERLGYIAYHRVAEGLKIAMKWYISTAEH